MQPIEGEFHDGKSTATAAVTLFTDGAHLIARDAGGGTRVRWPLGGVRRVADPGGAPIVRLRLGQEGAERLQIQAKDLPNVAAFCPNLDSRDVTWAEHIRPIVLWGGGAVVSVVLFFTVGLPWLARGVPGMMPQWAVESLGTQSQNLVRRGVAFLEKRPADEIVCGNPAALAAIENLLSGLTDGGLPRLEVLDTDMVNALALPGNRIVLFRGLIDDARHPNELAGVLAHELGHAREGHPLQRAVEASGTGLILALLLGDVTGGAILVGLGDSLISGAYIREKEHQADAIAIELMRRAGWDSRPMADFFRRIEDKQGDVEEVLGWFNTHPLSVDRAALFDTADTGTGIALTDLEWARVNTVCGSHKKVN